MVYHQDWLIRQIQTTIVMLARILLQKDAVVYDIRHEETSRAADDLHKRLLALIQSGKLNEAENLLFAYLDESSLDLAELALDFYSRLQALSDEELLAADFPRQEIQAGLNALAKHYGIPI